MHSCDNMNSQINNNSLTRYKREKIKCIKTTFELEPRGQDN